MTDEIFVLLLAALFALKLGWGFKNLPREGWQILAAVPVSKTDSGNWKGINFTYYGVLNANAYATGVAMTFILMGAVRLPAAATVSMAAGILLACMPASRLVARVVEKKKYTFTVGGASFVGIVLAPGIAELLNRTIGPVMDFHIPVVPVMAVLCIAYAFGEGLGRLACISFGCCYGKAVSEAHPVLRSLFRKRGFTFHGKTKKISYASGLEGTEVVPVQAITCVLYVGAGLIGTILYLKSHYLPAFWITLIVTQAWRSVSETMRADYRGEGKISAYQVMALVAIIYGLSIAYLYSAEVLPASTDIAAGLKSLWSPGMILGLQALWVLSFLYTGKSMVTGSTLDIHVHAHRI